MPSSSKSQIRKLSGRVLVADDDAQFRDLLVRRAEKMSLSVLEVEDGNEALAGERFDLIISDLCMPGHTGLEVIPKAQEKDPEIHAIILTASAIAERSIGWALG